MRWMFMPLRRYAEFSGRSRRKEYWMFALLNVIVWTIICLLGLWGASTRLFSDADELTMYFLATGGIYALITFIPTLAVAIRRLHDSDKSGWMLLLGLIPIVGGLILLVFYLTEGTRGPNRFGPDPLEDDNYGRAIL
ncbi:MAG: hypothetical protein QOD42_546 [Sphingomonadales bacterium]|jgi:uncharacterized membrane protein YhaH (DUF805 family)|nr:hypothetical protein [Sphingomonadales bacterium]